MRIRTARAIVERLALIGGLCAGAWCAAEGLDHGTAWADDPPIRIEQPGGLLDSHPSDTEQPSAEPTPPPETEPGDGQTAEPDRPRNDGDAGEVDAPDPTDGDDGRPQHPVDTPPDPGPTDPPPVIPDLPLPDIELPADPDPRPATPPSDEEPNTGQPVNEPLPDAPPVDEEPVTEEPEPVPPGGGIEADHPPFGGEHQPAPYVPVDVQTRSWGEPVCDGWSAPTPSQTDHSSTRDRVGAPRGVAGPGPSDPAPCDPDAPAVEGAAGPTPVKPPTSPPDLSIAARGYLITLDAARTVPDVDDGTAPHGRLTLWPPGPG